MDAALLVFRERGYHAASLTELGAAMELTAGSIYKAFDDKRSLFLAVFDRYTARRGSQLQRLLDVEETGLAKVGAMLRFYAESSFDDEGRRGCLVVGAATDLATLDPEIAARVSIALRRTEARLRDLIELGQSDGSIPTQVHADSSALALLCVLQGMRVVGKTGRTRSEMLLAADNASRLLEKTSDYC